jgi:hypothetical protein
VWDVYWPDEGNPGRITKRSFSRVEAALEFAYSLRTHHSKFWLCAPNRVELGENAILAWGSSHRRKLAPSCAGRLPNDR